MSDFKATVVWKDPTSLTPYVKNAKVHTTEQIDKIAGQISAVGFTQPIVVDGQGVIIAGHGRREAALRLGLKEVPVIVADHLDEYQVMAARIADNKLVSNDFDIEMLKFDLGTLNSHDFDLNLTGIDLPELKPLLPKDDLPDYMADIEDFSNKPEEGERDDKSVNYAIVFADPEELDTFSALLTGLKKMYPEEDTIALKMIRFLQEHMPAGEDEPALPTDEDLNGEDEDERS